MKLIFASILAVLLSITVMAQADDLSDRKAMMKSINGSLRTLNGQKADYNGATVAKEAANVVQALEAAQKLFGSKGTGETKAKDNIWSDNAGFMQAFANAINAANALKTSGDSNDQSAFADGFNQLAQTCSGCHRNYRSR